MEAEIIWRQLVQSWNSYGGVIVPCLCTVVENSFAVLSTCLGPDLGKHLIMCLSPIDIIELT